MRKDAFLPLYTLLPILWLLLCNPSDGPHMRVFGASKNPAGASLHPKPTAFEKYTLILGLVTLMSRRNLSPPLTKVASGIPKANMTAAKYAARAHKESIYEFS
jgi:hypothetical protein